MNGNKSKLFTASFKESFLTEAKAEINKNLSSEGRRHFIKQGLTLGGLMMITGCDITSEPEVESTLKSVSRFNDRVQAWLFDSSKLAPIYPESMISTSFPFNAFYSESEAPNIQGYDFRLELAGLIEDKKPWTLADLYNMSQVSQVTRHICVEGWSDIGKWGGIPLSLFLQSIGADLNAQYVRFICADEYYTSIDMATALHPQTIIALSWNGEILPRKYGYPLKIRIPTKLGYKNPKHVQVIEVTNRYPGGYWEDQGYNWFGGS